MCSYTDLEKYEKYGKYPHPSLQAKSTFALLSPNIARKERSHDELCFGEIRIRAEIKKVDILDRNIWRLYIMIDYLRDLG